ncbi:MAG: ribonuclease H-like domain-containing protein [Chloroflexi bacterium]|nr:ribonuclease H-like domain-containing protein [Chloroflexota bacterium]
MDLAERLRGLGYVSAPRPAAVPSPLPGAAIDDLVPGEWRETPHGRCFVACSRYPLQHEHGGVALRQALDLRAADLARLGRSADLKELDFATTAFLDTETTGLAGGTGTYVFLVGLGYFTGDGFVVEQYFMGEYGEEPAMLAALSAGLARFAAVVTFNGKAFDWPLLRTRFDMHRRALPVSEPLHLDLLFPARRLWRERLGSCCLSSLEAGALGLQRTLDVPGWLIPSLYFQYVRERDARPLRPVFAHNEQDVLSLLALTVRLGRHWQDPLRESAHPLDLFALGRTFEIDQDWGTAALCYEEALARGLPGGKHQEALFRLGITYKRLAKLDDAERVWRTLVSRPSAALLTPHVELAKYLEHREKRYAEAALVVERALVLLARQVGSPWQAQRSDQDRTSLEHRLRRLRRKTAAAASGGDSQAWREERQ